jgi:hypothetical protein
MKQRIICKALAVAVILLLTLSVTSSIGITFDDDTTPPVTTHSLNPPEPDGNNGWYVSDVNVTLTATDDMSGVKEIRYRINWGAEQVIPGDYGYFMLKEDGEDIEVEYWAVDYAGNVEPKNSLYIDIDQTEPNIFLTCEIVGGDIWHGWDFEFTATATDDMSGMERAEFYLNDKIQDTVYGPGPDYIWTFHFPGHSDSKFCVRGFISNCEITEEYVRFYAIIVKIFKVPLEIHIFHTCGFDFAGNNRCDWIEDPCSPVSINPGIYLFENLTLPNNYKGYIGRFFISATFKQT